MSITLSQRSPNLMRLVQAVLSLLMIFALPDLIHAQTTEAALSLVERLLSSPPFVVMIFVMLFMALAVGLMAFVLWRGFGALRDETKDQSEHESALVNLVSQMGTYFSNANSTAAQNARAIDALREDSRRQHEERMELQREVINLMEIGQQRQQIMHTKLDSMAHNISDLKRDGDTWHVRHNDNLDALREDIQRLGAAFADLKSKCPEDVQRALEKAMQQVLLKLEEVLQRLDQPPTPPDDTEPDATLSPAPPHVVDADAGVESAVKPEDTTDRPNDDALPLTA